MCLPYRVCRSGGGLGRADRAPETPGGRRVGCRLGSDVPRPGSRSETFSKRKEKKRSLLTKEPLMKHCPTLWPARFSLLNIQGQTEENLSLSSIRNWHHRSLHLSQNTSSDVPSDDFVLASSDLQAGSPAAGGRGGSPARPCSCWSVAPRPRSGPPSGGDPLPSAFFKLVSKSDVVSHQYFLLP